MQIVAGAVGQPPSRPGPEFQISVRALAVSKRPAEFENIILKTASDGALVRLRDVGRAELGAENYSSALHFNGHEAVGIGVQQLPNANAIDVDRQVMAALPRRLPFPCPCQSPPPSWRG